MRTLLMALPAAVVIAAGNAPSVAAAESPQSQPLSAELQKISNASRERLPQAVRDKFAQGIKEVRGTGVVTKAMNIGDQVPDATLLSSEGPVQLSSLWSKQPIVLTFYRGGWCPYCNASLRSLQKELSKFEGAGAQLVAVSPELPEKVNQTVASNDLTMTVLSDKGNQLAGKLGIAFKLPQVILPIYRDRLKLDTYNGDQEYTLPLAATYVIDTKGVIRWAFLDADYTKRAEPANVLAAVQQLSDANPSGPEPSIPHQQLGREAGVWDAEMTMWSAPGDVPMIVKAVETNTMMGPYWLVSEFKCDSQKLPFTGHMQLGYDPKKEKFIGTWTDTMSPYLSRLEGDYDISTRSLTMVSRGTDSRTGEPSVATMVTQYLGDGKKNFAIYEGDQGDKGFKMMEIRYTRRE